MKSPLAPTRYTRTAISFHWLMAILIIAMLAIGLTMDDISSLSLKFQVFQFHKSLGLLILLLACFRLFWRYTNPAPFLPKGTPAWQKWAAQGTHILLYLLMFAMPLSGWLFSDAAGYHPTLFGLPVPVISSQNPGLSKTVKELHELGGWALIVLIAGHFGAAFYHHHIKHDDILLRMLPKGINPPRLFSLVILSAMLASGANAQVWNVNPGSSRIAFTASFNGQPVNGYFKNWTSKIYFDPTHIEATDITITVDTKSVSTGEMGRDQTLQSPDWFNSVEFPKAVFITKKVTSTGKDTYFADGTLSLGGITKPLSFPFKLTLEGDKNRKARVFGVFPMSRTLFGVGKGVWQTNTEIADAVSLTIIVNAVEQ